MYYRYNGLFEILTFAALFFKLLKSTVYHNHGIKKLNIELIVNSSGYKSIMNRIVIEKVLKAPEVIWSMGPLA